MFQGWFPHGTSPAFPGKNPIPGIPSLWGNHLRIPSCVCTLYHVPASLCNNFQINLPVFDIMSVNHIFLFFCPGIYFRTTSQNIRSVFHGFTHPFYHAKPVDNVYNLVYKTEILPFPPFAMWITLPVPVSFFSRYSVCWYYFVHPAQSPNVNSFFHKNNILTNCIILRFFRPWHPQSPYKKSGSPTFPR